MSHAFAELRAQGVARDSGVVGLKYSVIVVVGLALAGCSSNLLGGGGSSAPVAEQSIPVGNQLALPPDLALRAPGPTSPTYRANTAPAATDASVYSDEVSAAPARPPSNDPYEKYGISKVNPDGTKKTDGQLREELRVAVLKEKRKTNPNYGTVRNIGELFRD
jgi:hypothetical protein